MYVYNDLPDDLSWPWYKKTARKIAGLWARCATQVKSWYSP